MIDGPSPGVADAVDDRSQRKPVGPRWSPDPVVDEVAHMTRQTVADQVATALGAVLGTDELPVRLRGWDGSLAGPPDAPVLAVRSRRALHASDGTPYPQRSMNGAQARPTRPRSAASQR